jgi:hypothetical protein
VCRTVIFGSGEYVCEQPTMDQPADSNHPSGEGADHEPQIIEIGGTDKHSLDVGHGGL